MLIEIGFLGVGVIIISILFLAKSVYLVRQAESVIIERFGRYDRTLTAGLHIVIPFIDAARIVYWTYVTSEGEGKRYYRFTKTTSRIDFRESVYDFPKQNVITKDNVTMEINALYTIKLLIQRQQFMKLLICLKQLKN